MPIEIPEGSQPLSMDQSFSYSWLVNAHPSADRIGDSFRAALDPSNKASFIEIYPSMPPSKRFLQHQQCRPQDFGSALPDSVVREHDTDGTGGCTESASLPRAPLRPPAENIFSGPKLRCSSSLKRCTGLSKEMLLQRYLQGLLRPLYRTMGRLGLNASGRGAAQTTAPLDKIKRSDGGAHTCGSDSRRSRDMESYISEAVLHCKRSRNDSTSSIVRENNNDDGTGSDGDRKLELLRRKGTVLPSLSGADDTGRIRFV